MVFNVRDQTTAAKLENVIGRTAATNVAGSMERLFPTPTPFSISFKDNIIRIAHRTRDATIVMQSMTLFHSLVELERPELAMVSIADTMKVLGTGNKAIVAKLFKFLDDLTEESPYLRSQVILSMGSIARASGTQTLERSLEVMTKLDSAFSEAPYAMLDFARMINLIAASEDNGVYLRKAINFIHTLEDAPSIAKAAANTLASGLIERPEGPSTRDAIRTAQEITTDMLQSLERLRRG